MSEPYQQCDQVQKEDCNYVTTRDCHNEEKQECTDEPYEDCEEVHFQVPKQVTRKKAFKVCDDGSRIEVEGKNEKQNSEDATEFNAGLEVFAETLRKSLAANLPLLKN